MSYITNGSFKFGTVDMYDVYGIQILDSAMAEDLLLPAIRPRKITIPLRHGKYDYGAKYYEERPLTINCVTVREQTENQARSFAREIAYTLSKKDQIRLWNEPDRYYIGRIEKEVTLTRLRDVGLVFTIEFICEPFAYGETVVKVFNNLSLSPDYTGTAHTPTLIEITNTGDTDVATVRVSQVIRKDTY